MWADVLFSATVFPKSLPDLRVNPIIDMVRLALVLFRCYSGVIPFIKPHLRVGTAGTLNCADRQICLRVVSSTATLFLEERRNRSLSLLCALLVHGQLANYEKKVNEKYGNPDKVRLIRSVRIYCGFPEFRESVL